MRASPFFLAILVIGCTPSVQEPVQILVQPTGATTGTTTTPSLPMAHKPGIVGPDRDSDDIPEANGGDRDGDGIADSRDRCPDDPEDRDGFQDEDGCPDPDNDRDGIPDVRDKCPNEPETYNGFQDDDGCPDRRP
jgi:hypothetical protein